MSVAGWALTVAVIAGLLILDGVVFGRRPHEVRFGEAVRWSVFYIGAAVLFGVVFGLLQGWNLGAQYFAGYVVEKSLSVDNLFVFVIIMSAFAVPAAQQPKALTFGITIALVLRAVFIALGAALLAAFSFMFLVFGLVLVATAVQLFRHRDEDPSIEDNVVVAVARRALPLSRAYEGGRLVTRVDGRRAFTPLFLVLLAIGSTDVLFALDSIPAVFGVSKHAYIVFVANAFALLGLRALFFLVAGLLDRLVYLSTGLALILAFIGAKLVLEFAHQQNHGVPEISTGLSLAVVAVVIAVTTVASLIKVRRDPTRRAHAGALREHPTADSSDRPAPGGKDPSELPAALSESEAAGAAAGGSPTGGRRSTPR
ncbi:MAG TPA: TerC/Alx family metal homeostasis membrane protein [Solirubrobacteraceae bacterium]|nr:TerC/Alx family metal homeostasis membrane protein [Solirubrobacteraceae bacterium]